MSQKIDDAVDEAIWRRCGEIGEAIREDLGLGFEMCESPIEEIMLVRLASIRITCLRRAGCGLHQIDVGFPSEMYDPSCLLIRPQVEIGKYRADFVLSFPDASGRHTDIVVECDGHDFHEKTKEQASRDKARDRFFAGLGIPVFRFTGSEIYAGRDYLLEDLGRSIRSRVMPQIGNGR
jgi:very-short-patch-repair endonuclease